MFDLPPVSNSADFVRVRGLPVRGPDSYPPDLAKRLTALLRDTSVCDSSDSDPHTGLCRKCGQPFALRDLQARGLYDAGTHRRGFFPLRVGAGKTLFGFLLPRVIECREPTMIVPAALVEKTNREWHALAKHWKVAKHIKFRSYQALGRSSGAQQLELDKPDLLIADECHFLKNSKAAVTRRVARYMHGNPRTIFVPMSGTIMKSSIRDFAHLLEWSHRAESPLPLYGQTLAEWAGALDEGLNPLSRRSPGVLLNLYPPGDDPTEEDPHKRARKMFFARTQACAGIVSSDARQDYDGSLYIEPIEYTPNEKTDENFSRLRQLMERPDGYTLSEAMQVWAVARMLALGLHYEYRPPAPEDWLQARKHWAKFAREALAEEIPGIDSEEQVKHAVMDGRLDDEYGVLEEWRRIQAESEFTPNSVPVWHDDTALKVCQKWMSEHPRGIVFVDHRFFGYELAKRAGVPYYGAEGLDEKGNFIEAHPRGTPAVASRKANTTGRNIQGIFETMLVAAPMPNSEEWEQMLGRLHRQGQLADSVEVYVLIACREHLESIPRALASSDVKQDLLGFTQKIRLADIDWPDETAQDRVGTKGAEIWRWA
jgi:hypothetical protein